MMLNQKRFCQFNYLLSRMASTYIVVIEVEIVQSSTNSTVERPTLPILENDR